MILNLSNLNKNTNKLLFNMDSIDSAVTLMRGNCYFAFLDPKDAYYSVSMRAEYRKYFCFFFHDQLYEFTVYPRALETPKIFTKILKPLLAHLRNMGVYLCTLIIL